MPRVSVQAAAACAGALIRPPEQCAAGCQPSAASRASGCIGAPVEPIGAGRNPLESRRPLLSLVGGGEHVSLS